MVAIREIVINSLVHSDFHADSEHQVTIDPDIIEIYSPGRFGDLTPIDYVNKVLPSRTKHKLIQGVLFKGFDIETLGRGFKRTNNACYREGVEWSFKKFDNGFSFVFKRSYQYTISIGAVSLLNYMRLNGGVLKNIEEGISVLNKKERTIRKIINELIVLNFIERIGTRKKGYWKVK